MDNYRWDEYRGYVREITWKGSMELKILALDTSNHPMGIALVEDDRLMATTTLNMVRNHRVYVLPTIERLMADLKWQPEDLDRVVVASGPGSYTGIRIATTTAKVLATTLDIELVAESSLKLLAANALPGDNRLLVPFFDARRGTVFCGGYRYKEGKLETVMADHHEEMSDLLAKLADQEAPVILIGVVSPKLKTILVSLPANVSVAPASYAVPSAYQLALLGEDGQPVADPDTLVPSYLRITEAEAQWQKQHPDQEPQEYVHEV